MLSAVSSVLHAKNALVSAADTLSDPQAHQSVSIRCMNTMFTSFITCFLGEFQRDYPHVLLDIRRYERDQILQAIRNREIDAGFIVMPSNLLELGEGIRFEQVCQSNLMLVCAPENELLKKERVTLDDLKAIPISNLVDDHSNMGWVTSAHSALSAPAKRLIDLVTAEIRKSAAE